MAKSERRQFTQEFKRNAVNLVMEKGVPVRKVARDHRDLQLNSEGMPLHPLLKDLQEAYFE